MATLQVRGPDFSVTKQKAIEDAKIMQSTVNEQCVSAGQEVPPYILSELIGKGSFGRVYKATAVKNSQLVAVKIIDIEESDTLNPKLSDTYGEFLKEINALKLLSNSGAKNINHVIDALPVGQSMWMITEYCAGGSVATLMKPTAPGGLQERWIIPILREVAEAIFWVHKQGIIHRDIKCANILIHEAGGVQLCDFGVAGVIETKFDKRSTFIGTLHWMAPELFAFEQTASYGTEVDIWAFGSMVYEIASGLPPNTQLMDMVRLGNHLKQHSPRLEGDQYSDGLKDLVAYALEESPRNRPTIEQIQRHPYIFNSSTAYPTSSLAMLVRAYKLWEAQGGSRKSLFAPGGAQVPQDFPSTALASDEWNFSTTAAFDQQVFRDNDTQTVYEAYGTQVDFGADLTDTEQTSRPQKGRGRRKPPNFPVLKAPLEKVFDPNTLTGYAENSKNYYGVGPPPPPTSDLPLRDGSGQGSDVRESLIDLDASLHGGELSHFADMETIRASGVPRASLDYSYSMPEPQDFNKPPLSDPEQFNINRRTRDWKFPTMAPPASANPEISRFPFNEEHSAPSSAGQPGLHHYTADPLSMAPTYSSSEQLAVPRAVSQAANRASAGSLIDLDMSLPDPISDPIRPSTAHSDVGSVTGSELGGPNNPFDLERHASLYVPFSNREPSIYVSDDSTFANPFSDLAAATLTQRLSRRGYHSGSQSFSSNEYSDNEYLAPQPMYQQLQQQHQPLEPQPRPQPRPPAQAMPISTPSSISSRGLLLPVAPNAPSGRVMLGQASLEEVKDEFRRLMMSFGEHLDIANEKLADLPVRRAARIDSLLRE